MGVVLLAVGLFLPWYPTDPDNPIAVIDGAMGSLSGWEVHPVLRWLVPATASAPFILVWIVIRGHELSWPRGELTAVAGFGLIAYTGVLDRPGPPSGAIDLALGFLLALLGSVLMIAGGALAAGQTERAREPRGSYR